MQPIVQWLNLPGHKSLELSAAIERGPALLVLAPVNHVYKTNYYLNMVGIHDKSSPNGYKLLQCKKNINDNALVTGKGNSKQKIHALHYLHMSRYTQLVPSTHYACCILFTKMLYKIFFLYAKDMYSYFMRLVEISMQNHLYTIHVFALQVI